MIEERVVKNNNTTNLDEVLEKLEEVSMTLSEAIATNYETNLENDLKNSEALATIYEAVLGGIS